MQPILPLAWALAWALALTAASAGAIPSSSSLSVKPFHRCRFHAGFRDCTLDTCATRAPRVSKWHDTRCATPKPPPSLVSLSLLAGTVPACRQVEPNQKLQQKRNTHKEWLASIFTTLPTCQPRIPHRDV